jgi:transcription initiation factor TFIIIB Brf1 subunit/transcription initiation factor TFIIB
MSRLKSLIEKGLGVLEEISECSEVEDNVIGKAYRKVLEDLEHLKYVVITEDSRWIKV